MKKCVLPLISVILLSGCTGSGTPSSSALSTSSPTSEPTSQPTSVPTSEPTSVPTSEPTSSSTSEITSTSEPTSIPTSTPTSEPTSASTSEPTSIPTSEPLSVSTSEPTSTSETPSQLVINDMELYVYGSNNEIPIQNAIEGETFTYDYSGENLRIENNHVVALKAQSETTINVVSSLGRTTSFKVTIPNRDYVSTHSSAESSEGWFDDISVDPVTSMTDSFANGMDISSIKQLYDNYQQFYNREGVEQSLFYILKDAGVNWIRLRLWNKPYDEYEVDGVKRIYYYGGGNCHIDNVTWMAHEAKAAGLNVLLDIHYSDFWTDPSHQIVPKDWVNISSVNDMAKAIREFTRDSVQHLIDNDARPDMVSIGNETQTGMLFHNPGGITTSSQGNNGPHYHTDKTERTDGTQGGKWDWTTSRTSSGNFRMRTYFNAGINGVKDADENILTMIHFVRGFSDANGIKNFFYTVEDLDFDVYGLSAYPSMHIGNMGTFTNSLNEISSALGDKKLAIAETSYGFTYETDNMARNLFSATGDQKPISGYPATPQGQASIIRDITEKIANLDNGFGVFYWEGAWTPTKNCGWADKSSKCSYANQAFFSYNGKALGSLDLYQQMKGN